MANSVTVDLPDNLTIANIHPIHERFEALVDDKSNDQITIRAGAVTRADTAGIQLLRAFIVAAKERQIAVAWDSPSPKLCAAADILGMKESLGMHEVVQP